MLAGRRAVSVYRGGLSLGARVRDRHVPLFDDIEEVGWVTGAVDRGAHFEDLVDDGRGEVFDVFLRQVAKCGDSLEPAERLLEALPALAPQVVHNGGGLAQESAAAVDHIVQRDEQRTAEDAADGQPVELSLRECGADQVDGQRRKQRTAAERHEDADGAVVGAPDQGGERPQRQRARADDSHRESQDEQRIRHAPLPRRYALPKFTSRQDL